MSSVGSLGPGGIPTSAQPSKPDQRDADVTDATAISFAGLLGDLFRNIPVTPSDSQASTDGSASASAISTDAPAPQPQEPHHDDAKQAPPQAATTQAPQQPQGNNPPANPADEGKTPPQSTKDTKDAKDTSGTPQPTQSTKVTKDTSNAAQGVAQDPLPQTHTVQTQQQGPQAANAQTDPQAQTAPQPNASPPTHEAKPAAPPQAPPPPQPLQPTDTPAPTIVRHIEVQTQADSQGPAQAPAPASVDANAVAANAPQVRNDVDFVAQAASAVRVDVAVSSAQVTAVGAAPAPSGGEAGLDARTGGSSSGAPVAASAAQQGGGAGFSDQLAEAQAPQRLDPAPVLERVVGGMRITLAAGQTRMKLLLSPPKLGSLQVDLEVKHGVLNAHLQAETADARDLLTKNLGALQDALKAQGLKVGDVTVAVRQDAGGSAGGGSQGGHGGGSPSYATGDASSKGEEQRAFAEERRRLQTRHQVVDYLV